MTQRANHGSDLRITLEARGGGHVILEISLLQHPALPCRKATANQEGSAFAQDLLTPEAACQVLAPLPCDDDVDVVVVVWTNYVLISYH